MVIMKRGWRRGHKDDSKLLAWGEKNQPTNEKQTIERNGDDVKGKPKTFWAGSMAWHDGLAGQLERCEQGRAEKSAVQIVHLKFTVYTWPLNLIREKGTFRVSRRRTFMKSWEQSAEICGRPVIRGAGGRRSIWGNGKGTFLMRWVEPQENVVLMKPRAENFKETGIASGMKCC